MAKGILSVWRDPLGKGDRVFRGGGVALWDCDYR
jgi:hypothetical protein